LTAPISSISAVVRSSHGGRDFPMHRTYNRGPTVTPDARTGPHQSLCHHAE
jgi:hypothetical protein